MGVPYEIKPMSGMVAVGGTPYNFVIDFPSRSLINKIVVKQYDGTLADFTFQLFNNATAEDHLGVSDSIGDNVGPIPEECFAVTPPMTSTSPGLLYYFSDSATGGHGFQFFNTNAQTPGTRNIGNPRKLYARITFAGSGSKMFAVSVGGEIQVNS